MLWDGFCCLQDKPARVSNSQVLHLKRGISVLQQGVRIDFMVYLFPFEAEPVLRLRFFLQHI